MKKSVKVEDHKYCQNCRYHRNHPSRCTQYGMLIARKGKVSLFGETEAERCTIYTED